jgi:hypothetical protein
MKEAFFMYNSYEEYMQSVLGMNMPNTYMQEDNNYYGSFRQDTNVQELNRFYPEIYGIVYPVVQKVCSKRSAFNIGEDEISNMVDEVLNVVEPREEIPQDRAREANVKEKNGDVKNPRVQETRRPNNNRFLRDLIRILIIRELLGGRMSWTRMHAKTANARTWTKTANAPDLDIWGYINLCRHKVCKR